MVQLTGCAKGANFYEPGCRSGEDNEILTQAPVAAGTLLWCRFMPSFSRAQFLTRGFSRASSGNNKCWPPTYHSNLLKTLLVMKQTFFRNRVIRNVARHPRACMLTVRAFARAPCCASVYVPGWRPRASLVPSPENARPGVGEKPFQPRLQHGLDSEQACNVAVKRQTFTWTKRCTTLQAS